MSRTFLIVFSAFYFLLLAVHVFAGEFGPRSAAPEFYHLLARLTKPLLLLSLIGVTAAVVRRTVLSPFAYWLSAGLVLSLAGDVLLMFQSVAESYFTFGLAAFLCGHIAYIVAFTRTYRRDHEVELLRKQGWLLVAVAGYAVYFFSQLAPSLGSMIAPVMLYTIVITLMLLMALSRFGKVCNASFWPVTAGAALFVASDSVLAWNKFAEDVPFSHFWIMGLYGTAQFLIAAGGWRQLADEAEKAAAHNI